jgi:hypothetical protein
MTDNHQRHLVVTFQHVDNLLAEVEQILAGSSSPFQEYAPDATPKQRQVAHDHILRTRETMRRILTQLDIPLNDPITGAVWAARSHLAFARIAAVEIDGRRMRAYGTISPEDEQLFNQISSELHEMLGRLEHFLAQDGNAQLFPNDLSPE